MRAPTMRLLLRLLALLIPLAACDGGGTGTAPLGGEYIAVLQSPHGAEGAAILELTGEGIQEVVAASATLFQQPVNGGRRVMLVREPGGRIEFRVRLAEGAGLPAVRVLQVVDGDDVPRSSTDGYQVSFTRTRGDT